VSTRESHDVRYGWFDAEFAEQERGKLHHGEKESAWRHMARSLRDEKSFARRGEMRECCRCCRIHSLSNPAPMIYFWTWSVSRREILLLLNSSRSSRVRTDLTMLLCFIFKSHLDRFACDFIDKFVIVNFLAEKYYKLNVFLIAFEIWFQIHFFLRRVNLFLIIEFYLKKHTRIASIHYLKANRNWYFLVTKLDIQWLYFTKPNRNMQNRKSFCYFALENLYIYTYSQKIKIKTILRRKLSDCKCIIKFI